MSERLVTVREAQETLLRDASSLGAVERETRASLGWRLADAIASDIDMPPFDRAQMDGYAIRAAECASAPREIPLSGSVAAGEAAAAPLAPGTAVRILTGAPLPTGADAVVRQEDVEVPSPGRIRILVAPRPGLNVTPRGEELRAGAIALPARAPLTASRIALAAALGLARVRVIARPTVAVAATGDELLPDGAPLAPGRIRNSNGPMLLSLLAAEADATRDLGIVRDTPEAAREAVRRGLASDVLVLSGGVSVGDRDHVNAALEAEGVRLDVRKVAVKPGKPFVFGRRDRTYVFGLPGNPVSAFVTATLFVRPVLRALAGHPTPLPAIRRGVLAAGSFPGTDREQYRPCAIDEDPNGPRVVPVEFHGAADLAGLARGEVLFRIPAGAATLRAGDAVEFITA